MTALWKGFLGLSLLWQVVVGCVAVVAAVNALVTVSGLIVLAFYWLAAGYRQALKSWALIFGSARSWRIPRFWRRSETAPAS